MRKVITRGVLTVLAVLFLASQASAASIAIGWLQWMVTETDASGAPTVGQFSIVNQTGANYLFDPAFPVVDQLTFNPDLNLATEPGGLTATLVLNADNISYDSTAYLAASFPRQATLTGTVDPLQVLVDLDGEFGAAASLWNILGLGAITNLTGGVVVLGDGVNPLGDGDTVLLYVDAVRAAAVPEPGTLILLGSGAIGLLARRRRAARA